MATDKTLGDVVKTATGKGKKVQEDGEFSQVTVRLPKALRDRLFAEADARVVGVSLLVAKAVEKLLNELAPQPELGIGSAEKSDGWEDAAN